MSKPSGVRLFIALWPPAAVQDALFVQGERFAGLGRRVPARNLHLTLAFLGQVELGKVELLGELLDQTRPQPCILVLDRLGYFPGSRTLWAGCSNLPAGVGAYQQHLADALDAAGFRAERRPFRVHVSLLRDAAKPAPADLQAPPCIPWQVDRVALVRSDLTAGGARYTVLSAAAAG